MIGEGIQSSNQRRHSFVKDQVEVGFFTDPSVCIGCKACEVACKEWNHVPDDGFTWSGNSYDNTGHLGASTWRHVMFLEQDRQKGNQIVGSHSLATVAWKRVQLDQLCGPRSARSWCRTMSAMAAATAWCRVRSG